MRKASLLASMLAPVLAAFAARGMALSGAPMLANLTAGGAGVHRRAAGGPTNALKIRRAAHKARNVKRNRSMHRG